MYNSRKMSSKSSNTNDWPSRCTVDRVSNELLSQSRGESSVCSACNGYYGQANGQPVCLTCHAFLYASGFDAENVNLQLMSEERDDENDSDRDSGNEEPNELFYVATGGPVPIPSDAKSPTSMVSSSARNLHCLRHRNVKAGFILVNLLLLFSGILNRSLEL